MGQGRLEGLDPPRRRLVGTLLGPSPGDPRERARSSSSCSTRSRPARSWPRCRASSRCPRAKRGCRPRTRSARWATTSSRKGDLGPFRVKIRSASFNNISIASWVLKGVYVPDIITILASALLHPRRHRPVMIASLAVEIPYWGQSLLRVLGGLVAVLLPAGTIVYLFLFKMMSFMQSRLGPMEAGPYGSMQLLAEVGKWLQKEDIIPENADATDLQDGTGRSCWCRRSCWSSSCRSVPTPASPNFARRRVLRPRRSVRSR